MRTLLLLFALVLAGPAQAQPDALASARRTLDAGTLASDADSLSSARARLAVLAGDGEPGAWAVYYGALADYRLAYAFWGGDAERAGRHAASGAEALAALRDRRGLPDALEAEAAALHSALLSARMGLDPSLAMSLGPASTAAIDEAARLAPDNPRVQFVQAMTLASTPPEWGGDPDRALALFRSSIDGFEAEAGAEADPLAPRWGRDDAYAWAGLSLLQRGDLDGARTAIEAAERLNPTSSFVQYKLKPWLEAEAAKRAGSQ